MFFIELQLRTYKKRSYISECELNFFQIRKAIASSQLKIIHVRISFCATSRAFNSVFFCYGEIFHLMIHVLIRKKLSSYGLKMFHSGLQSYRPRKNLYMSSHLMDLIAKVSGYIRKNV